MVAFGMQLNETQIPISFLSDFVGGGCALLLSIL
jgi:hypothetical protein